MIVARTRAQLAGALDAFGSDRIALVPTMGALHAGHLSLMDIGVAVADRVAASVFVNPLQFGPGEDLDRYPRDLEGDLEALAERGVDLVFAPEVEEMYPAGAPVVSVDPGALGERLCGLARPGHFRGVLTVVARLFGFFRPSAAVFGRKDFQQAVLVRRMIEDLAFSVDLVVAPIVREPDGLAMSSRNRLLPPDARVDAVGLRAGVLAAREAFRDGETRPAALEAAVRTAVSGHGAIELEYAEVVDARTLARPDVAGAAHVLAVAGWCGGVRLIDNDVLGADEAGS